MRGYGTGGSGGLRTVPVCLSACISFFVRSGNLNAVYGSTLTPPAPARDEQQEPGRDGPVRRAPGRDHAGVLLLGTLHADNNTIQSSVPFSRSVARTKRRSAMSHFEHFVTHDECPKNATSLPGPPLSASGSLASRHACVSPIGGERIQGLKSLAHFHSGHVSIRCQTIRDLYRRYSLQTKSKFVHRELRKFIHARIYNARRYTCCVMSHSIAS